MFYRQNRSVAGIVLRTLVGIVVFLLILYIANKLIPILGNGDYQALIYFFNENAFFLILITLISFMGDLFFVTPFPVNSPAPIFKAVSGVMLASFIFKVLLFLESILNVGFYELVLPFKELVYGVIVIIILVVGYIKVFAGFENKDEGITKKEKKEKTEWVDIGEEFKQALYNLGKTLRLAFQPKKK